MSEVSICFGEGWGIWHTHSVLQCVFYHHNESAPRRGATILWVVFSGVMRSERWIVNHARVNSFWLYFNILSGHCVDLVVLEILLICPPIASCNW